MRFFFSSRRRHTRCALETGVQTCALPIYCPAAARGPLQDYVYGQNGNDNIYAVYQNTPAYGKSRTHGASGVLEYEFSDAAVLKSTTAWRGVYMNSLSDNDGTPYLFTGEIGRAHV